MAAVGHAHRRAMAVVLCAVLGGACAGAGADDATRDPAENSRPEPARGASRLEVRDDLLAVFEDFGTPGAFALYDVAADRVIVVDSARATRRYTPASTYKIPNSLIALETGAVADETEIVPYGGEPQPFEAWERDMDMRDAFAASNVPVYQEIARRIGLERMQEWVDRLDYGNRALGDVPDRFWLDGPLAISAVEQVRFLARLSRQELPAAASNQRVVRELALMEETPVAALFGKTGWIFDTTPMLGWWVGWVEREGRVYTFALNVDLASEDDVPKRIPLGRELLDRLDVLAAPNDGR